VKPQHQTIKRLSQPRMAHWGQEPEAIRQRMTSSLLGQATEAAAHHDRPRRDREIHEALAGFSKQERVALAAEELCPTSVMRHLVLDRPVVQCGLANNPAFTSQLLGRVVRDFDWGQVSDPRDGVTSARLVFHPSCPAELAEFHLEEYCWFDPIRWLLHPDLPLDDVKTILAEDGLELAMAVIRREEVLPSHLELISNNPDARVRTGAAMSTKDSQMLTHLADDPDELVRQAASQSLLGVL
jgi:hypothetical protein